MATAFRLFALGLAASVCLFCAPRSAFAQDSSAAAASRDAPSRAFHLEVLGGMGFGNSKVETGESLNAFGPLVSVRGAYAFSFGGNLALRAEHFFGSSSSYPLPLVAKVDYERRSDFVGLDFGFDLHTSHAVFRPYVGLGALMLTKNVGCSSVSSTGFDALSSELCTSTDSSKHPIYPTVAPGLSMSLVLGRLSVILEPRFYYLKGTNGFASTAGMGISF